MVFHPNGRSTVLRLSTSDGYLTTPPVLGLSVENEIVVAQFSLNILLENLSFSTPPFQTFTPVEVRCGCLHFPLNPSHYGHPVQQTQHYNDPLPMFQHPPPILDPPRMINNDLDNSIPWNSHQQRYMSNDRTQHVQSVRDRLRPNRNNVSNGNVPDLSNSRSQPQGSQPPSTASAHPSQLQQSHQFQMPMLFQIFQLWILLHVYLNLMLLAL